MLKTYVRKLPFYVKARQLWLGEVIYDAQGKVIPYQPGDWLIELETDRYTMGQELFTQLYREVEASANGIDQDLPQTEPPDLRERRRS
jgi:hypothetical protein